MKKYLLLFLLCPLLCRADGPPAPGDTNSNSGGWLTNMIYVPLVHQADDLWLEITGRQVGQFSDSVKLVIHGCEPGSYVRIEGSYGLSPANWVDWNDVLVTSDPMELTVAVPDILVAGQYPVRPEMCFFRAYGQKRTDLAIVKFSCGLFLAAALRKVFV